MLNTINYHYGFFYYCVIKSDRLYTEFKNSSNLIQWSSYHIDIIILSCSLYQLMFIKLSKIFLKFSHILPHKKNVSSVRVQKK